MKARNYRQILENRGYKAETINEYQGTDVYTKKHTYNTLICKVEKDSHGKAQKINFIVGSKLPEFTDLEEFKEKCKVANLDREYLIAEAERIKDYFEQLKVLKSPKHIYCFN